MRDIKTLLQQLVKFIENHKGENLQPIDVGFGYNEGMCTCLTDMVELDYITDDESGIIGRFLEKEIEKKDIYFDYPITYGATHWELFYFPMNDWDIRLKWLNQIINTL